MENRINHIIARVLSGESSSDDILSLSEWLNENEKNRDEFRRLKNYWDADVAFKHSVAPAFSADKLQQKINVQRRQTARRQLWRNAIPLIAAACLLFIFSTALFLYNTNNRTSEHYTLLTDEHTSNFTLEDGTVITLNKNSRLSYSDKYGKDSRNVKLEGEAYFEVESDKEHPFIVKTKQLTVEATGTAFNVNAYAPDHVAAVTLVKGKVAVTLDQKKTISLSPGEKIDYNLGTALYNVNKTNTYKWCSWKDGILIFRDDPLEYVFKRLGQTYNVEFILKDAELGKYSYKATFEGESLNEILRLLEMSAPIRCKEVSNRNTNNEKFEKQHIEVSRTMQ